MITLAAREPASRSSTSPTRWTRCSGSPTTSPCSATASTSPPCPASELDRQKLITLMVGRELTHMFPKEHAEIGEMVLSVRGLTRRGVLEDISFDLQRGEILGPRGPDGRRPDRGARGDLRRDHDRRRRRSRSTARRSGSSRPPTRSTHGSALLTEDRKLTGIMGVLSVRDNMTIASLPRFSPGGILHNAADRPGVPGAAPGARDQDAIASHQLIKLTCRAATSRRSSSSRWLLTQPEILMIDEPTRGIDVGAKSEIHRLMSGLAQEGKAILMVSSEMPEILGMSDRVLVMREGRLTGRVQPRRGDAGEDPARRRRSRTGGLRQERTMTATAPTADGLLTRERAGRVPPEVRDRLHLPRDVRPARGLLAEQPRSSSRRTSSTSSARSPSSALLALGVTVVIISTGHRPLGRVGPGPVGGRRREPRPADRLEGGPVSRPQAAGADRPDPRRPRRRRRRRLRQRHA